MEQYIKKSALVAEIERKRSICKKVIWDLRSQENKDYYQGKAEAYEDALSSIDTLEVKDLQEKPVSIDFEKELYKAFGQVKDFTLCMQIAKWFYDMGKNSQEPISEELEEELSKLLKECEVDAEYVHQDFLHIVARHFANWQKEQFEKNRLEHCNSITEEQYNLEVGFIDQHLDKYNRMPTFLDAIEYGMKVQKEQFEKDCTDLCNGIVTAKGIAVTIAYDKGVADAKKQMMANAVDVTVHIDAGGYPYTPEIELYDYDKDVPLAKEGDKYKVVLIKEE